MYPHSSQVIQLYTNKGIKTQWYTSHFSMIFLLIKGNYHEKD